MDFELGGAFLTRSAENATKMFPFIKESLLHIYIEKTTLYSSVTCLRHKESEAVYFVFIIFVL